MLLSSKNKVTFISSQYRGFVMITITLLDINENREYGVVASEKKGEEVIRINNCRIREVNCNSEAEWEMLVKPYMEE
jgi:hypothetical protein